MGYDISERRGEDLGVERRQWREGVEENKDTSNEHIEQLCGRETRVGEKHVYRKEESKKCALREKIWEREERL